MKKKKDLSRFSVAIRSQTREKIDQMANKENRSRSNLIDMACEEYWNTRKEKSIGHKFIKP